MKKLLAFVLGLALLPAFASAQQTVPAGGTGLTSVPTNSFLAGFDTLHLKATSSPFFSLFSFGTATGTSATTTTLFSTNASTTNLFGTNITGFGLTSCNGATSALTFSGTLFGCHTISAGSSASTTLLGDNNTFSGANTFTQIITGSISGNAGTATTLATGRTISISGDLTYTSPSFNGSGNVTAAGTLATVNANVGSFTNANITVNGKGLVTAAANGTDNTASSTLLGDNNAFTGLDTFTDLKLVTRSTTTQATTTNLFATTASTTNLFVATGSGCLQADATGKVASTGSNCGTSSGGITSITAGTGLTGGTITTTGTIALDLTAQNIFTGASTTFVGGVTIGKSTTTQATTTNFFSTNLFGTTGNLTDLTVANTITGSISGNAGTATKLATARTIAISGDLTYTSPSFDGSGNVTAAGTLATVNTNTGSFGGANSIPNFTVNGKGLITAAGASTPSIPASEITTGTFGTGDYTFPANLSVTTKTTSANFLATGSSTLQNFTFVNATGTQATTTNFAISNIASGNCLQTTTGGAIIGSGSACGSGGSSASSTLLADNNAFTGLNTFTDLKLVTRSTTTNATTTSIASTLATTTNLFVSNVGGSTSGKFLAADINGKVIDLNSTLLVLSIVHGGTGAADSVDGFDNLSPLGTKGDILTDTDIHNVALAVGSDESFLQASSTQTDGLAYSKISLARSVLDTLAVSHGGTACSSGSITCIDNITGGTHTGTGNNVAVSVAPVFTGITSVANLLASASSTLQAFTFTNATGSAYQLTGTNNVPVLGIYSPAVNQMAFSTASTFRGLFDANGRFALGTSTPTFDFTIASTSPTFELDDTDGATNNKHLLMSYNSGIFAIGTSSDTTLTSTSTDLTLNPLGPASFSVGTTSTAAILNLGDNPNESGTASSTMSTSGKFQIDTYNNAGARVCVEITTLNVFTVIAGACTN